jgi:hypothetical protein
MYCMKDMLCAGMALIMVSYFAAPALADGNLYPLISHSSSNSNASYRHVRRAACPADSPCCCSTASGSNTAVCMTANDCKNIALGKCLKHSEDCDH